MVRVISVHHFTRQDVAGLERAGGRGVASARGNVILVGGEHKVDIRDLKLGAISNGSFPTVDLVQQIIYCTTGNYVCALETKPARHGGDHKYVRVYLQWDQENDSAQPMRARIAGRVTPSSQSCVDNLEMVEIPSRKPAEFIACCQSTGNIAVASGMSVTIFRFCHKTHDISKHRFIDFEEIMELDMSFIVKEVSISEDIIGCVSESEVHVFQLALNNGNLKSSSSSEEREGLKVPEMSRSKSRSKSKTRSASRSPCRSISSSISSSKLRTKKLLQKEESMSSVIRQADDLVNLDDMKWVPTLSYGRKKPKDDPRFLLFPSLVGAAQCGLTSEPGETYGPVNANRCSNVRVKIVNAGTPVQKIPENVFEAVTLIYRHADHAGDPDIPFSNLLIQPVYPGDNCKTTGKKGLPARRPSHPLLPSLTASERKVGASIFVTTPHVGQLYHVTLDTADIYGSSVVRGGVFSYTAPVYSVALEPSLLHALTLTGLETYTLRPHPHIVVAHLPQNLNIIVPPHWEETVCLVGLRPFLNVETLTLTSSCLALIASNPEGGEKSHTVYSLHLPSSGALYKEMVRVGRTHWQASPPTYLHLLLEAHLVITTALHHNATLMDEEDEDLYALLQDSAALLGDYYASCSSEVEWQQAVQYYQVSSLSCDAVIERLETDSPGLLHIISSLLLNPTTPILTAAQANCALDTLEKIAPQEVSQIILKSSCFKEYKKDKVLGIIKGELSKTAEPRASDVLALALVFVERGSSEQVSVVLASLRAYQLIEALLQNSKLLLLDIETTPQLSPLAQVLSEHKREVFMEVFVSLIGEGTLSLNAFVDSFVSVYPIMSAGPECNIHSLRLRDFLETFFLEYAHNSAITEDHDKYDRAITVLVSLYLASLMGGFADKGKEDSTWCEQRAALMELYGPRPLYLNLLPPFNGRPPTSYLKSLKQQSNKPSPKRVSGVSGRKYEQEPVLGDETGVLAAAAAAAAAIAAESSRTSAEDDDDLLEVNCTADSTALLHLLVLQSLLSSDLPSAEDRTNVLKFVGSNPTAPGAMALKVLCLTQKDQLNFLINEFPTVLLQYAKDVYESSIEWEDMVCQLLERKSSLPESDPTLPTYTMVLNEVLSELCISAPLDVFLCILPVSYHEELRSYIRQCHTTALAQHLKSTLVTYANNVLEQMSK